MHFSSLWYLYSDLPPFKYKYKYIYIYLYASLFTGIIGVTVQEFKKKKKRYNRIIKLAPTNELKHILFISHLLMHHNNNGKKNDRISRRKMKKRGFLITFFILSLSFCYYLGCSFCQLCIIFFSLLFSFSCCTPFTPLLKKKKVKTRKDAILRLV